MSDKPRFVLKTSEHGVVRGFSIEGIDVGNRTTHVSMQVGPHGLVTLECRFTLLPGDFEIREESSKPSSRAGE